MMNLSLFHREKRSKKVGATELRLQSIRFCDLLENARSVNDLFAQGIQKIRGDYIFDRHFVVSLVDKVLEKIEMIVFDACVLVPKGGMALYRILDEHKKLACRCFLEETGCQVDIDLTDFGKDIPDEPEFKLLAGVLSWLSNKSGDFPAMMDFIKLIFDHTMSGLGELEMKVADTDYRLMQMNSKQMRNLFRIIDLGGGVTGTEGLELSLRNLHCRPFGLMFIGLNQCDLSNDGPENGKMNTREWLAIVSNEHLSLQGADYYSGIRLEATLTGYVENDFIFIFVKNPTDPEEFVPENFRIEKTNQGAICWTYDVPSSNIENDLIHLGRWLFGTVEL
jgi:hypothetical protein